MRQEEWKENETGRVKRKWDTKSEKKMRHEEWKKKVRQEEWKENETEKDKRKWDRKHKKKMRQEEWKGI